MKTIYGASCEEYPDQLFYGSRTVNNIGQEIIYAFRDSEQNDYVIILDNNNEYVLRQAVIETTVSMEPTGAHVYQEIIIGESFEKCSEKILQAIKENKLHLIGQQLNINKALKTKTFEDEGEIIESQEVFVANDSLLEKLINYKKKHPERSLNDSLKIEYLERKIEQIQSEKTGKQR